jgi:hypothetical protein
MIERGMSRDQLLRLPLVAPRPRALGGAVYSSWFAIVGLVIALATGASPWQEIGLVAFVLFGTCAAIAVRTAVRQRS